MKSDKNVLDIVEKLEKGEIIFVKNGIIQVVEPLEFGEITLHYQNGVIDRTTTKITKKI